MKDYKDLVKLLNKVAATGGLDCDMASICDYQDMIGHSSAEQLRELSNGSCKEAFYRVYGVSYGTLESIRFYLNNADKIYHFQLEKDELAADLEDEKEKVKKAEKDAAKAWETSQKFQIGYEQALKEKRDTEQALKAAQDEIVKLKARLFDLLEK